MQLKFQKFLFPLLALIIISLLVCSSIHCLYNQKKLQKISLNKLQTRIITSNNSNLKLKCERAISMRKEMQNKLKQLSDEFNLKIVIDEYEEINLDNLDESQLLEYNDIESERISELFRLSRQINHAAAQLQNSQ